METPRTTFVKELVELMPTKSISGFLSDWSKLKIVVVGIPTNEWINGSSAFHSTVQVWNKTVNKALSD